MIGTGYGAQGNQVMILGEQRKRGSANPFDRIVRQKSPLMVGCFLLLWAISLALNGPRLWQVVSSGQTAIEATLLVAVRHQTL